MAEDIDARPRFWVSLSIIFILWLPTAHLNASKPQSKSVHRLIFFKVSFGGLIFGGYLFGGGFIIEGHIYKYRKIQIRNCFYCPLMLIFLFIANNNAHWNSLGLCSGGEGLVFQVLWYAELPSFSRQKIERWFYLLLFYFMGFISLKITFLHFRSCRNRKFISTHTRTHAHTHTHTHTNNPKQNQNNNNKNIIKTDWYFIN